MKKTGLYVFLFAVLSTICCASPVIFHISNGISGSITSLSVQDAGTSRYVVAQTSTGVYLITKDGKLKDYFPATYPVTDAILVGNSELVISTKDQKFPNIMAYNTETGKLVWEYKPEVDAYDPQLMWVKRETKTWDLEQTKDLNQDSLPEILAASGSILYLLDGKSGRPVWNFSATNDIFTVKSDGNMIVFGSQDGVLYSLDLSGKLLWKKDLIPEFLVKDPSTLADVGTVKRSVWDIILADDVFVSGEDGYVYKIDKSTGGILEKQQVISYDDNMLYAYYGRDSGQLVPSGPQSGNFFNLRIKKIGDSLLAVTTYLGTTRQDSKGGSGAYAAASQKIILLDSGSLGELQQIADSTIGSAKQVFSHDSLLYYPGAKEASVQSVHSFGKDGKSVVLKFNTSLSQMKSITNSFAEDFDKDSFVFASDDGDLFLVDFTAGVRWSFPRYQNIETSTIDFNSDGIADLFVRSVRRSDPNNENEPGRSRMMFLIDGRTNSVLWNYTMPYNEYLQTQGLQNVLVISDVNGDSYKDILAFVQRGEDQRNIDSFGEYTRIVLFSGKDGKEIWRKPVVPGTYYGPYENIYSDSNYGIAQLDSYDKKIALLAYNLAESQRTLNAALLGGVSPGQFDLMNGVRNMQNELQQSQNEKNQFQGRLDELLRRQNDFKINKRIQSIQEMKDINNDGVNDLFVSCQSEVYALSGKDASVLWFKTSNPWKYKNMMDDLPENHSLTWNFNFMQDKSDLSFRLIGDLDSDGISDLIAISWDKIMLVKSSANYTVGWTRTFGAEKSFDSQNVKIVDDLTQDNASDILVSAGSDQRAYRIINSRTGKDVMSIPQDGTVIDWAVADFNGDSVKDSISFSRWSNQGPVLEILSGKNGEVIYSYNGIQETFMLEQLGVDSMMPATAVPDLNGDGVADLAIARTNIWTKGAELIFVDVKDHKELKKFELETGPGQESRYQPALDLKAFSDKSKKQFIAVTGMFADESGSQQLKVVLFDLGLERTAKEYRLPARKVLSGRDGIYIVTLNGDIYLLNSSWENSIINPKDNEEFTNIVKVDWHGEPDSINTVLVNGQAVEELTGTEAELNLKAGTHEICLKTEDILGNTAFDYVMVKVQRSRLGATMINLLIILAILSLVAYNYYVYRMKK